jgi:hypothetical protein
VQAVAVVVVTAVVLVALAVLVVAVTVLTMLELGILRVQRILVVVVVLRLWGGATVVLVVRVSSFSVTSLLTHHKQVSLLVVERLLLRVGIRFIRLLRLELRL